MDVSSVDSSTAAGAVSQTGSTASKSSGSDLSMDDFFQLLSAQLEYQDPMEPTDNSQFMAQMAQFSLLEQVQNLSKTIDMSLATTSMGKSVVYNTTDSDGNAIQSAGAIAAVDLSQDTPEYMINGAWIPQTSIVNFYDPTQFKSGTPTDAGASSGTGSGTGA